MADKQIIIDDVDVSGCCHYADGKCTNSHMIQSNCKNVAVCFYKQLKRKEQECEELKEYKEDLTQRLCDMNAHKTFEIVELKQTLAEIKKIAERGLNYSQCSCGAKADLYLVLQKINEVEDDLV